MIKDTQQKAKAIRYCVSLGFVPHMEVVVRFLADISDSPCNLTDIDVLGILPGAETPSIRVIFDCKTLNKISPINRAFWAKGLMEFTNSSEAFVILGRPAIDAHRLAGNSFGVKLFSEPLFDVYSASVSAEYLVKNSYLEDLSSWEKYFEIGKNYPNLNEFLFFLNSSALLQSSGTRGLRSLMSHMRKISGELDPSKNIHRALFKIALSQFTVFVNEMVRDFHNIFDPQSNREQFEKILRYYIWDGRENYDIRQKLNNVTTGSESFEFPAWDKFVDFFRTCLDSPFSLSAACLPIKDMAFRELASLHVDDIDRRLSLRLKTNNRIRQFSLAAASYLSDASKFPREFRENFSHDLNSVIDI